MGQGCFCGWILIKGLDGVFPKAVSPQTEQGNVLDLRLKSGLKCFVANLSVKVIVIPELLSHVYSHPELHTCGFAKSSDCEG